MADIDFKTRNEFRKGTILRKIDEDPTFLSFMFLFHYNDHSDVGHSPLLDGTAENFLRNVVRKDVGKTYADNMKNFVRVLRKVNTDIPWFFQSLKGLELALNYDLTEPWRGNGDDKILEIGCLEENVELTAVGLMDLYKRSCFDYERYVEVVPKNLREFSMDVIVSEVRVFQKTTDSRNENLFEKKEAPISGVKPGGSIKDINENYVNKDFASADVTPFIRLRFTHCEFDPNSIADFFSEMTKNPEKLAPTLKIKWGTCRQIDQKLGVNLFNEKVDSDKPINKRVEEEQAGENKLKNGAGQTTGDKYLDAIRGRTTDKIESVLANTKDAVTAQANSIANSFANPDQPGLVKNLLDRATEDITGALLLGNVHGLGGTINDITTAIKTGSLNAVGNLVGNLVRGGNDKPSTNTGPLGSVGDNPSDSTPDNIDLGKVFDELNDGIGQAEQALGKDNVHGATAPDNDNLGKENVHE